MRIYEKVILNIGGVETLDYFSKQMGQTYEKMGLSVFYFDLREPESSAKKCKKFIKRDATFLLTFNFEGLERESGVFTLRDGYIWQQMGVDCVNIAVDHPYWYDNRFKDLLEDELHHPGLLCRYFHVSIDRNHEKYMKRFYPEFHVMGFVPLAGTNPLPDEKLKPFNDRKYDILFTGHYTKLSFFDKSIYGINDEYAEFYKRIIRDLLSNPRKTVEEVEEIHCEKEMGKISIYDKRLVFYKMLFIDLYVRNYFRGQAVKVLCDNGYPVTVIGKGWEDLPVEKKANLTILPKTDSYGCLMALRDTKISLNVLPYFKDGAHDRVFNSILNGAFCLTDDSVYLREMLKENEGLSYYDLSYLTNECVEKTGDSLVEKINALWKNQDKLESSVEKGIEIVRENHTWDNRARKILEMLQSVGL